MTTYDKNSWRTPPAIFKALNKEFDFVLDAAASHENALVKRYLTREDDALSTNWRTFCGEERKNNEAVFINPPYDNIAPWMTKAMNESVCNHFTVVMLVPASTDARWWPKEATEIRFITHGRISFLHPDTGKPVNGNTKGSAIIVFRPYHFTAPVVTRYINRETILLFAENELAGK